MRCEQQDKRKIHHPGRRRPFGRNDKPAANFSPDWQLHADKAVVIETRLFNDWV
jgi:hypothetical protein